MKRMILGLLLLLPAVLMAQDEEKKGYPVGKVERKILFSSRNKETFLPEYNNYIPDEASVKIIKEYRNRVKMKIVMGFWCDDSKVQVPRMLKILDEAKWDAESDDHLKIFGVDENKQAGFEGFKALSIVNVPTFIVYYDDMEIGRIVESPKVSLEKDLVEILKKIR
jgi:hypothetical protein